MEFLTCCWWNFCLIYGILAFSGGNSRFESGSPGTAAMCKSRDYKERQAERKKRKVFVTAPMVLRTAAMFLTSALK